MSAGYTPKNTFITQAQSKICAVQPCRHPCISIYIISLYIFIYLYKSDNVAVCPCCGPFFFIHYFCFYCLLTFLLWLYTAHILFLLFLVVIIRFLSICFETQHSVNSTPLPKIVSAVIDFLSIPLIGAANLVQRLLLSLREHFRWKQHGVNLAFVPRHI